MGNRSSAPAAAAAPLSDADLTEWQKQQRSAVQIRNRLQLSLSRMDYSDARHAFLQQLLEQLTRTADMQPGMVPLKHYATLVSNAAAGLSSHSDLIAGATAAEIARLPTRRFRAAATASAAGGSALSAMSNSCTICQLDYADNDELRTLPCWHSYHRACIDRWLSSNGRCPECRTPLPP